MGLKKVRLIETLKRMLTKRAIQENWITYVFYFLISILAIQICVMIARYSKTIRKNAVHDLSFQKEEGYIFTEECKDFFGSIEYSFDHTVSKDSFQNMLKRGTIPYEGPKIDWDQPRPYIPAKITKLEKGPRNTSLIVYILWPVVNNTIVSLESKKGTIESIRCGVTKAQMSRLLTRLKVGTILPCKGEKHLRQKLIAIAKGDN